jgi:hypothetical protein
LCAIGRHALTPLQAQIFRHDQHHLVAAHRRGHRQGDAGIATGRFDQRIARLDIAARFGALDHCQRRPVLDRPGRVIPFQLAKDDVVPPRRIVAGYALELH